MTQETIKEFIAKIGFSVDEPSQRRFMAGIEAGVVKANLLASALEGMARVAVEKVAEVAATFEQLGYQASRAGTSAQHIRAFEFAVSQLGGTAAAAGASVQNFGRLMRLTDNQYGFIEGTLGIATKVNGVARDNIDVMNDIAVKLAEMSNTPLGRSLAEQFRQRFQIDEPTLLAMEKTAQFQKLYQDQLARDVAAGIGGPEAVKAATDFEQAWRNVTANIDANIAGLAKDAETFLTPVLQKLDEIQKKSQQHEEGWFFRKQLGIEPGTEQSSVFWRFWATLFKINTTPIEGDALNGALTAVEKFAQDVETDIERLPFWRWLLGIRVGSGPVPFGGIGESGQTDTPVPDSSIWGGIKRFFGFGGGGSGGGGGGGPAGSNPGKGEYDVTKAYNLIKSVGGTDEEAQVLAAIAQPESGGNPRSHNTKGMDNSYGLWQINMLGNMGPERLRRFGLRSYDDLFDPKTNARVALQMAREAHGYRDWSTYRSGAYRPYLKGYRPYLTPDKPFSAPTLPKAGGDPGPDPKNRALRTLGYGQGEGATWNLPHAAAPREDPNAAALAAATNIDTSRTISSNVTNNVNVYGSGDPHTAAAAVGVHLDRNNNDLVRNMQGASQ